MKVKEPVHIIAENLKDVSETGKPVEPTARDPAGSPPTFWMNRGTSPVPQSAPKRCCSYDSQNCPKGLRLR